MTSEQKFATLLTTTLAFITLTITSVIGQSSGSDWQWSTLKPNGEPIARHEAGLVECDGKIYLIGGRRINETSVYDPVTNAWTNRSAPPIEIHHFQPVSYKGSIYIIGAMTGQWPNEVPVDRILIYQPESDSYEYGDEIPKNRRRGGAGAVLYQGSIYLVGGIINGHMDGFKPWFDSYDLENGNWEVLQDAPHARDHFQTSICQDKLYAFAGRTSSRSTGEDMSLTVAQGDIYDFNTGQWIVDSNIDAIPTERAGNMAMCWQNQLIIAGGESMSQLFAHREVEVLDLTKQQWVEWPPLRSGRHGTGFAIVGEYLYTASGCGNRGGQPELVSIERLKLPTNQ